MTGQDGKDGGDGRDGWAYAGLGIQLAGSLLLFVLVGQWLDRRLGGTGWVTIALALVGFGATFYSLVRKLTKDQQ